MSQTKMMRERFVKTLVEKHDWDQEDASAFFDPIRGDPGVNAWV